MVELKRSSVQCLEGSKHFAQIICPFFIVCSRRDLWDDKFKNTDSKAGNKGSERSFGLVNNGRDLRSIMEESGISPANQLHLLEALLLL
jgi:hypothetical protein